jgi:pimeloyl-ACP methyl ester carboxylesterase
MSTIESNMHTTITRDLLLPIKAISRHSVLADLKIIYVIPQAPDRSWWTLDLMLWGMSFISGQISEGPLRSRPRDLPAARSRGLALVEAIRDFDSSARVPLSKMVIAGFSQGAMTAVDLALQLPPDTPCGGVVAFSGSPIVIDEWKAALAKMERKFPALITHGLHDPVLPFGLGVCLRDVLSEGGCEAKFETFSGGHELGPKAVEWQ